MAPSPVIDAVSFNAIDVAVAIAVGIGIWRGFRRGLSGELARLISLAVATAAGWLLYRPLGERLTDYTRMDLEQAQLAAFLCVMAAGGLAMLLLRLLLRLILEFRFKTPLEQIGGMGAGAVRALILSALVVVAAGLTPVAYLRRVFAQESWFGSGVMEHVVPVYRQVAGDNPDLGLPTLEGLDRPPGEGRTAGADSTAEPVPAEPTP